MKVIGRAGQVSAEAGVCSATTDAATAAAMRYRFEIINFSPWKRLLPAFDTHLMRRASRSIRPSHRSIWQARGCGIVVGIAAPAAHNDGRHWVHDHEPAR